MFVVSHDVTRLQDYKIESIITTMGVKSLFVLFNISAGRLFRTPLTAPILSYHCAQ